MVPKAVPNPDSSRLVSSPEKNRALPGWITDAYYSKPTETEHATENNSTSKGNNCKRNLTEIKEQKIASNYEGSPNRDNNCSTDSGNSQSAARKKAFLKDWSWAIPSLEDFNLTKENKNEVRVVNEGARLT